MAQHAKVRPFDQSSYVTVTPFLAISHSAEPEFINLLESPGIDSQPGGPVQQPYLA